MNLEEHTHPSKFEKYSFLWSEARLIIAAVALFLGGVPVLRAMLPIPALSGLVGLILTLTWIISGAASAYLLYRWFKGNKMLFGRKVPMDTAMFFVSVISGINLGFGGLTGRNIGMSISSNRFIFIIVGILYIGSAWYLYKRWKSSGRKIFLTQTIE